MKRTLATMAAAGLMTLGLAACGGGDDETAEPAAPPPAQEETEPMEEEVTSEEPMEEEMTSEEPMEEEMTSEEPMEEEMTSEGPADDSETSAAPGAEGDAAQWCMGLAELGQDLDPSLFTEDPEAAVQLLEDLREGAPGPVADNLDVMIENVDAVASGNLEDVDQEALQQASTEFQTNAVEACSNL